MNVLIQVKIMAQLYSSLQITNLMILDHRAMVTVVYSVLLVCPYQIPNQLLTAMFITVTMMAYTTKNWRACLFVFSLNTLLGDYHNLTFILITVCLFLLDQRTSTIMVPLTLNIVYPNTNTQSFCPNANTKE